MATLTPQSVARTGLTPTFAAADVAGDEFVNDGNTLLHVKNGDAASKTVTVASQVSSPPVGTAATDLAITIPAGEERMIGPLPKSAFDDANGKVQVTYDAVTSVTVAAVSMGSTIQR